MGEEFNEKRKDEVDECQKAGFPAFVKDIDLEVLQGANLSSVGTLHLSEKRTLQEREKGIVLSSREAHGRGVFLVGQCAGAIDDVKPAAQIIDEMVALAADQLRTVSSFLVSKL